MLERIFKLSERGTNVRTEIMAGVTTFMTMAYILAVNPMILSSTGMEFGKVFTATALSSAIATLVMGFMANLPYALSAGMGLNAFFAYSVCIGMGYPWQWALTAIFVEGIIFIILTFCNIREAIVNSVPDCLKRAISVGIGLFIAYIGLKNAGIIVPDESNLTVLKAEWMTGTAGLAIIGLIITEILLVKRVRGALLYGIIIATIVGIPIGVTTYAGGSFAPDTPYFFEFAFKDIMVNEKSLFDFVIVVLSFLFVDMFDTVGALIGCAEQSNLINEDGSVPNCKEALFADAVGTTAGAILGTSTVTTFSESAAGVSEGGRTGLTSVTVAVLFLASLFFEPLFGAIPSAATAPALVIVGVMMLAPVKDIDFSDYSETIPAFLTIIFMVCASSVSDGIMFGVLSYVIVKAAAGEVSKIRPALWLSAGLFVVKIIVGRLNL